MMSPRKFYTCNPYKLLVISAGNFHNSTPVRMSYFATASSSLTEDVCLTHTQITSSRKIDEVANSQKHAPQTERGGFLENLFIASKKRCCVKKNRHMHLRLHAERTLSSKHASACYPHCVTEPNRQTPAVRYSPEPRAA